MAAPSISFRGTTMVSTIRFPTFMAVKTARPRISTIITITNTMVPLTVLMDASFCRLVAASISFAISTASRSMGVHSDTISLIPSSLFPASSSPIIRSPISIQLWMASSYSWFNWLWIASDAFRSFSASSIAAIPSCTFPLYSLNNSGSSLNAISRIYLAEVFVSILQFFTAVSAAWSLLI